MRKNCARRALTCRRTGGSSRKSLLHARALAWGADTASAPQRSRGASAGEALLARHGVASGRCQRGRQSRWAGRCSRSRAPCTGSAAARTWGAPSCQDRRRCREPVAEVGCTRPPLCRAACTSSCAGAALGHRSSACTATCRARAGGHVRKEARQRRHHCSAAAERIDGGESRLFGGAGLRQFGEAEGRTLRRLPCGRGCVGARDVDAGPREDRPPGCAGGSGNRPEMILQCMRIWQCMRMHARSDLPHTRAKRSHVGKPPGEGPTCGHHRHGHTSRTASALAPIRRGRHLCRPMQARTPARRARKPWPDTLYVGHVEVCHVDKDISESLSQKTCKQKARRRVSRRA